MQKNSFILQYYDKSTGFKLDKLILTKSRTAVHNYLVRNVDETEIAIAYQNIEDISE